ETTGVVGKAERLTWHKAWTMVSTGFSISYTSRECMKNVWYNKNIINKIECCSVDNLQSLLSIIAAKMKSMIYQK
ncbi:hypothetical protein, partial [Escherichia coli]|uniref:hypothetical protein n=1 Tax=Escherichia coli TaxID=562 RepID=UPI002551A29C